MVSQEDKMRLSKSLVDLGNRELDCTRELESRSSRYLDQPGAKYSHKLPILE